MKNGEQEQKNENAYDAERCFLANQTPIDCATDAKTTMSTTQISGTKGSKSLGLDIRCLTNRVRILEEKVAIFEGLITNLNEVYKKHRERY